MKNRTLQVVLVILITFFVGYFIGVTKINLDWQFPRDSFCPPEDDDDE